MTEVPELSKSKQHNIDVVVDRIVIKEGIRSRLFDSIEAALRIAEVMSLSTRWTIRSCSSLSIMPAQFVALLFQSLEPRLFSFNAPFGSL